MEVILEKNNLSTKGTCAVVMLKIHRHHDDNVTFQNNFNSDISKVYKGFSCNPFEMKTLTCISNTGVSFDDNIFYNLSILETTGRNQLNKFIQPRGV